MKTIRVSNKLHKKIMDRKDSKFTSADLVIGWLFEQEQAVIEANEAYEILKNKCKENSICSKVNYYRLEDQEPK